MNLPLTQHATLFVLISDRLELTPSARGTLALWQEFKRLEQQGTTV